MPTSELKFSQSVKSSPVSSEYSLLWEGGLGLLEGTVTHHSPLGPAVRGLPAAAAGPHPAQHRHGPSWWRMDGPG